MKYVLNYNRIPNDIVPRLIDDTEIKAVWEHTPSDRRLYAGNTYEEYIANALQAGQITPV